MLTQARRNKLVRLSVMEGGVEERKKGCTPHQRLERVPFILIWHPL
jgi:hypothetical protein